MEQPPKETFRSEPGPGLVRLLQIRDFSSDDKAVYISDSARWQKCEDKDILVGRYGASVGKVFRGKSGAYNVALIKMMFSETDVDRDYLFYWLQGPSFQQTLQSVSRSAQNGFNKDDLRNVEILLPPLHEQKAMAHRLSTFIDSIRSVRLDSIRTGRLAIALEHAIISTAFDVNGSDEFSDEEHPDVTVAGELAHSPT